MWHSGEYRLKRCPLCGDVVLIDMDEEGGAMLLHTSVKNCILDYIDIVPETYPTIESFVLVWNYRPVEESLHRSNVEASEILKIVIKRNEKMASRLDEVIEGAEHHWKIIQDFSALIDKLWTRISELEPKLANEEDNFGVVSSKPIKTYEYTAKVVHSDEIDKKFDNEKGAI